MLMTLNHGMRHFHFVLCLNVECIIRFCFMFNVSDSDDFVIPNLSVGEPDLVSQNAPEVSDPQAPSKVSIEDVSLVNSQSLH